MVKENLGSQLYTYINVDVTLWYFLASIFVACVNNNIDIYIFYVYLIIIVNDILFIS